MDYKVIKALEFNKIIEILKGEAVSSMAKTQMDQLFPLTEVREIEDLLEETTEGRKIVTYKGPFPIRRIFDCSRSIGFAMKGGTLTGAELLALLNTVQTVKSVKNFLRDEVLESCPIISGINDQLTETRDLEVEIERCILSEDEISDHASPELKHIRRKIGQLNETLRHKLNGIISNSSTKEMLQEPIFTLRNGRYVVPVKQGYRSRFSGIIHDQSSTGATLFIEPSVVVEINNQLREAEINEKQEIQRILKALSEAVALWGDPLIENQKQLTRLDFISAKAKLSLKFKGVAPLLNDKPYIHIINGRHPLIPKEKVVPITIENGDAYRTLVITGPNTGGKTVTLKTVGLLTLMAQCGLHIPCDEGSEIGVFKEIFIDIGDEQSIEQSLSTFSSHMTHVVSMIKKVNEKSLVLLDELAAGTDPTEGAALAIAILDHFYDKGAITMATTHYTELKKYALVTEGVMNGSVEFDVETLSPTYRLTIGTPGSSNAFEISRKLGLGNAIIEKANQLIGQEEVNFEKLVKTIEQDRKAAEADRDAAILLKIQANKIKEENQALKEKLTERREKLMEASRQEAKEILKETKAFSDQIFKELRALESLPSQKERNKEFEVIRKKVKNKTVGFNKGPQQKEPMPSAGLPIKSVSVGDQVKIRGLDKIGIVLSVPEGKKEALLQVEHLKMTMPLSGLETLGNSKKQKENRGSQSSPQRFRQKSMSIATSIDVRGEALDNALMDINKYLDDACLAGLSQVTLIHGRGEGVLRKGIWDMLKRHKHVKEYRYGDYTEGGDGATIATLK